ncbi:uncharacterized protein LOC111387583 [Olea europaea var. sylvestris]|uniref:uncharacterized protein LOC111387583 n=1 Tax=Olea europaea var. sylvestris TaxID=158386 RepID=UPI000C1D6B51|nr:uncharacterized protein LOC111387583 [Olea europaea var. sylvestris]
MEAMMKMPTLLILHLIAIQWEEALPLQKSQNWTYYNGLEEPTRWVCQVEQFFEFQCTKEMNKPPMARYHLDGDVQLWYLQFKQRHEGANWDAYKSKLDLRYGPSRFQNFFGDLTKLKHIRSVREYQMKFDRLFHRASHLSEDQQVIVS